MNNKLIKQQTVHEKDFILPDNILRTLEENFEVALGSLSNKNRKEYEATLRFWSGHAHRNGFNQLNFDLMCVKSFLTDNRWSFNTRKVRLAHIRRYAELLSLVDTDGRFGFAFNYGRLNLLKPKSLGGAKQVNKTNHLSNKQVYKVFDAVTGDSNRNVRNRAILGLMLLAGLRASEIVSLKWHNALMDDSQLFIYEGKGDKSAYIPMLGDLKQLLRSWKIQQAKSGLYIYVCTQIFRSDKLAEDKQPTTRLISTLCSFVSLQTGFTIKPHDGRNTVISALLSNGASVPETRDFARHASGETTLRYAQKSDAVTLGSKLKDKLKYGDVLGASPNPDTATHYECANGHKFYTVLADLCPECGSDDLIKQVTMFDF